MNALIKRIRRSSRLLNFLTLIAAALLAFLLGGIMLVLLGANPFTALKIMVIGSFGNLNAFANTVIKTTPLLFVGLGICISFRAGVLNIGGEGQLVVGAIAASSLALALPDCPGWLLITICILAGGLAGAIWGGIAGVLKAYFRVNEVLSTIMLNYIATYLMNYLLRGCMMDPMQVKMCSFIPQTARLPRAAFLPGLVPSYLHIGILIGILFAVLVYIFIWRTTIGFRLRVTGENQRAARGAGINTRRYMVLAILLSGALAGVGGSIEILGVHHRMFTDGSAFGFTGMSGYYGIVAALFGQLNPLGTIPASFFLGAILTGGNKIQRFLQVPSSLLVVLSGLIVLFVVGSEIFRRRQAERAELEAEKEAGFQRVDDTDFEESG